MSRLGLEAERLVSVSAMKVSSASLVVSQWLRCNPEPLSREPGFEFHCHQCESVVVSGRASGQRCFRAPEVPPYTSKPS